jgi:hypothetical protein
MAETSNALCVDGVVLPMGADEPDINDAIRIVDPDHEAILVAGDVKDRAAVLENTGAANISLDVRRLRPIGPPYLPKPCHQRLAGIGNIRASAEKGLDRAERDYSHRGNIPWSHIGTKAFVASLHIIIDLNALPSTSLPAYLHGRNS